MLLTLHAPALELFGRACVTVTNTHSSILRQPQAVWSRCGLTGWFVNRQYHAAKRAMSQEVLHSFFRSLMSGDKKALATLLVSALVGATCAAPQCALRWLTEKM